jgi:hypothetical protein
MGYKMYTNQSFASHHKYVVLQGKPRIAVDGHKYIHFQIPGPEGNRKYGYVFDAMVDDNTWEELLKVCAKVEVDVTYEKDENKEKQVVEDEHDGDTYEEDENNEQEEEETAEELIATAQGLHQTLDVILEQYKDQLNEQ